MLIGLAEAVRITGKSKSTLWRAIKDGRMSATRTPQGEYQVDVAELARAFQIAVPETADPVPLKQGATTKEQDETALELALLRQDVRAKEQALQEKTDEVQWLREELRQASQNAQEATKAVRLLLTHQEEGNSEPKGRWLIWLGLGLALGSVALAALFILTHIR